MNPSQKLSVSCITPTGARPEVFRLCVRWVEAQTFRPDEWIIVDDGVTPTQTPDWATTIRPEIKWKLGENTQKRNLLIALEEVKGDIIAVIEDDDYYSPLYLHLMTQELFRHNAAMIGLSKALYYNLMYGKYRGLGNNTFAPLGMTVFRKSIIPTLLKVLSVRESKFDVHLWKNCTAPRQLIPPDPLAPICVGMKGVPGRPGLGIGHSCEDGNWNADPGFSQLKYWLESDRAQDYIDLKERAL